MSRLAHAIVFAVGVAVSVEPAMATTHPSAPLPIAEAERLKVLCSTAEAIAIGRVVTAFSGYRRHSSSVGAEFVPGSIVTFRVQQSLKGPQLTSLIHASLPAELLEHALPGDVTRSQREFILFLRPVPEMVRSDTTTRTPGSPPQPTWYIPGETPDMTAGMIPVVAGQREALVNNIMSLVAIQTPESLAQQSDLVIEGSITTHFTRCSVEGRTPLCVTVGVDRIIAGSEEASEVRVYGRLFSSFPEDSWTALLFLRRTGPRQYEILGYRAGALAIVGDSVPQLGAELSSVRERIRLARKSPERPRQ